MGLAAYRVGVFDGGGGRAGGQAAVLKGDGEHDRHAGDGGLQLRDGVGAFLAAAAVGGVDVDAHLDRFGENLGDECVAQFAGRFAGRLVEGVDELVGVTPDGEVLCDSQGQTPKAEEMQTQRRTRRTRRHRLEVLSLRGTFWMPALDPRKCWFHARPPFASLADQ